ncbi:MAG: ABC transporter permease [Desulfobacterales bacterium]|nr:ABC transporter permease [Desulfobacterales bacterium]
MILSFFFKRAVQDILDNKVLNAITIFTITLSILIIGAFTLFFINTNDLMGAWEKNIRIMAYLKPTTPESGIQETEKKLKKITGVYNVRFISKKEALNRLKNQLKRQSSLLEDLNANPLPDAFEISLITQPRVWEKIENIARLVESIPSIDEVEYGQRWIEQFTNIFYLFKLTGYAMGGMFLMAAVLIIANTIRLVIYSRRSEIEIMRIVGATDSFIKAPFYIEGIIQGAFGSILGITILFLIFKYIFSNIAGEFSTHFFYIRFLPFAISGCTVVGGMFLGWFGSYLSLRQFLKL